MPTRFSTIKTLALLAFFTFQIQAKAWGFLGHQTINYYAVFALPPELFAFYKNYIHHVKTHAVDADNRRYLLENEACRHYIDADHYEYCAPLDTIPHNWKNAIEKYTEDTLTAYGIVPWHVQFMKHQLSKAFQEKNIFNILKISSDIGHYIADAHVPLHATSNYNGQETNQVGIHALWESRLPALFYDSIFKLPGTATYITNTQEYIWERVSQSYGLVDSVLLLEKLASQMHPFDKKGFETTKSGVKNEYSRPFCTDYYYMLNNMVERRMLASIQAVAAFWYTAWVDAGQPDLSQFTNNTPPLSTEENPDFNQKMKGRQEYDVD